MMENASLKSVDPTIYELLKKEKKRQIEGIELIASENFVPAAILEAVGSCAINKYAEGYPGKRYYSGTEVIDEIENLAIARALEAYNLDANKWGVNVQALSGSPANLAVFTALVKPGGRIMGLALSDGGHLTHGYYTTSNKRINASSLFFESLPYRVNQTTGLIDYDELERSALLFRPRIIIAGISSYSRNLDYQRFRSIANKCKCLLMADMAHTSGLVAHGLVTNPFLYCDIVTTTTHKTMRAARGSLIFFRKDVKVPYDASINIEQSINEAVFPTLQGGPHQNNIAGIAVGLNILKSDEFKEYAKQVIENAKALVDELQKLGYKIVTDGTENHMCSIDLNSMNLDGAMASRILEMVKIAVNKNTIPGDVNALKPHGIRLGTPAMTSRAMKETDFRQVATLIHKALQVAKDVVENKYFPESSEMHAMSFEQKLSHVRVAKELDIIKEEVIQLASRFPMPGHEDI